MATADLQQQPDRMTLSNLATGRSCSAQYNPDEVKEELAVNYERLEVLGQSFQPMQYKSTGNLQLTFELGFDAVSDRDVVTTAPGSGGSDLEADASSGPKAVGAARRFLLHLCYPGRAAQGVADGGPPQVLVFWPGLYSLTCRLVKVTYVHRRWSRSLETVHSTAQLAFEVDAARRIYADDVLAHGTAGGM